LPSLDLVGHWQAIFFWTSSLPLADTDPFTFLL